MAALVLAGWLPPVRRRRAAAAAAAALRCDAYTATMHLAS
jgi:hypothetical protein